MSWIWGLGLCAGMATVAANGLLGLLGLVMVDAAGLFLFGWLIGKPGRDPAAALASVRARHFPTFILVQVFATAITGLVVALLIFQPLMGAVTGWAFAAAVTAMAAWWARAARPNAVANGHAVAMAAFLVGAALAAVSAYGSPVGHVPRVLSLSPTALALVPGTLLGFAVGPWIDVQQWRRACHAAAAGVPVRRAYLIGSLGFALVMGASAVAVAPLVGPSPDLSVGAYAAIPRAAASGIAAGGSAGAFGWALLGCAVLFTSVDSACDAIGWLLDPTPAGDRGLDAREPASHAPPSPAWLLGGAALVALAFAWLGLSPFWLVMPFATLLAGAGVLVAAEATGRPVRGSPALALGAGAGAFVLMGTGMVAGLTWLVAAAPGVSILASIPARERARPGVPAARAQEGPMPRLRDP